MLDKSFKNKIDTFLTFKANKSKNFAKTAQNDFHSLDLGLHSQQPQQTTTHILHVREHFFSLLT